jgi:peptidoglycan/xylan/chitin deacetylase (PgdA/CDA1 family)
MSRHTRVLAQRLLRRPIVLGYHRIAVSPHDPFLLSVSPEHFVEHLDVLKSIATPMPLVRLVRETNAGRFTRGAVALSFDDGYVDNVTDALPRLEHADTPATVFVATGSLGAPFLWDELVRLILDAPTLPRVLDLGSSYPDYSWQLGATEVDDQGDDRWDVRAAPRSPREALFSSLWSLLRPLKPVQRDEILASLSHWSVAAAPRSVTTRCMKADEINEIAASDLVEIGAHTVNHPVLAAIRPDDQEVEVEGSALALEEILGVRPTAFAYPFGGTSDYNHSSVAILRSRGFDCACTTIPGTLRRDTDPLQVPRFLVRDWGGEEFERRLRGLIYG